MCGCEQQGSKSGIDNSKQFAPYSAESLEIIGLSELTPIEGRARLKLFVRAMDSFGSAVKLPSIFRIELYDYVERSPSAAGKRIEIWPDIDLVDREENNAQWRDHLRAYEFNLDVKSKLGPGGVYIVEVTCQNPLGKRMSAQRKLKF